ncbi:hypothetical protein IFM89_001983 [Coptis chinensis]|uniref:Uncharacterized protein n=1 Tax=Coptis chinensis TaxID=261450 RepID=A0A835LLF2_9MAGN|nr:hypothetical protein IFM89_001983 [Coptis chinensis]
MLFSCYLVRYSNVNRYCSPFYHVNAFKATYGGYIFPFDNEEDWGKVKPEDVVQPPPLERHPGKDQPSKKSRKADEANEAEDIEPEVGNAENNEG